MNNRASLQLGGDNWAAKDANLLAYKTSLSEKNFLPIEFDFERGANLAATRVDENGLIEKGRENLLLQSNQFDTTWATSAAASVVGGQTGYDGSSDAWLLSKTGANQYIQQQITFGGINTLSAYIKAGTSTWVALMRGDGQKAFFDLSGNGALGNVLNGITSKIESIGSGWFRCSFTFENSSTNYARIYPADGDGDTSGTSGNLYIQDAQLEVGLAATDYIETGATTAQAGVLEELPRINYSGSTPSLLLEPERTNSWIHSEYLDYSFSSVTDVTRTQNTTETLSPEGLYNATKLEGIGPWGMREFITGTNTGTWTISCYVKAVNPSSNNTFRLSVGGNNHSSNFTATEEWQRFEHTFTNGGATATGILRDTSTNDADLYIYGFQVEEGSYPTSYIPTYGTAATRGVDTITSPTVFNGGSAFSLYFEMGPIDGNDQILLLQTSPLDFYFRWTSSTTLNIWNQDNNSVLKQINGLNRNQNNKILMVYDGSGGNLIFVNGTKYTAADYTWPSLDYIISIGSQLGIFGYPAANSKTFKSILVFPEALSDAECITLTTL